MGFFLKSLNNFFSIHLYHLNWWFINLYHSCTKKFDNWILCDDLLIYLLEKFVIKKFETFNSKYARRITSWVFKCAVTTRTKKFCSMFADSHYPDKRRTKKHQFLQILATREECNVLYDTSDDDHLTNIKNHDDLFYCFITENAVLKKVCISNLQS